MDSIHQFFRNLASNNIRKYDELLSFSKDFILGEIQSPITHIFGSGKNGKTTLISLLWNLANKNGHKIIRVHGNIDVNLLFENYGNDIRYIVLEELNLDDMSGMIKLLIGGHEVFANGEMFKPKINFISISNSPPNYHPDLLMRTKSIHMDAIFNHLDPTILNRMLVSENRTIQFIMNYRPSLGL